MPAINHPYQVLSSMASGGMGRLWLGRSNTGERVVIKVAHLPEDDERIRDEARVGMRLSHPHIVDTLDLITWEGRPALVTAYVDGEPLLDIRNVGPLPQAAVMRVGKEIALALAAIHEAIDDAGALLHMVHRDVTPANVLIGTDGRARLIDLGIARSTETRAARTESGAVRGTIRYMAPELFADQPQSPQSDLWSLGVVLWEALLGRPLLDGAMAAVMHRICQGDVVDAADAARVEARVARVLSTLLQKDPRARAQSARDAAALFAMCERDLASNVSVDPPHAQLRRAVAAVRSQSVGARDVVGRLEPTGVYDDDEVWDLVRNYAMGR